MKVHWTGRALARLDAIQVHIAQHNPDAALRIVHAIVHRSTQIKIFPHSGRRVADYARDDVRELIEGHYRIVYRVLPAQIDVVAVMHAAQLLPTDLQEL